MAKKNGTNAGGAPPAKKVANRDHYARISFLFQLATANAVNNPQLARVYAQAAQQVAKKNVLRLSPHIKRSLCRKCSTVLVPGITSRTRITNGSSTKASKCDVLEVSCGSCASVKRYPVGQNENYELWVDRQE